MLVSMFVWLSACATPAPPAESAPVAVEPEPETTKPAETQQRKNEGRRVVAIGDLHGDPLAALAVLKLAGLSNDDGNWIGGDTVLVQTGDLTDRGPDSGAVIDLLKKLRSQAPEHGGEVRMLLGNHEVMNLQGDWRYVNPEEIAKFGGESNRALAYSKNGEYGAFLATLPLATQVDDTVFVHGGITPEFAELGLDGINTQARAHYFDRAGPDGAPIHGERGPTWFRGYVNDPESTACPLLDQALAKLNAKRMVVGHTTRRDGVVQTRCDGKITVIDIGVSAHYGGHLGVWEAIEGDARALMPSGPVDLPDPK